MILVIYNTRNLADCKMQHFSYILQSIAIEFQAREKNCLWQTQLYKQESALN